MARVERASSRSSPYSASSECFSLTCDITVRMALRNLDRLYCSSGVSQVLEYRHRIVLVEVRDAEAARGDTDRACPDAVAAREIRGRIADDDHLGAGEFDSEICLCARERDGR